MSNKKLQKAAVLAFVFIQSSCIFAQLLIAILKATGQLPISWSSAFIPTYIFMGVILVVVLVGVVVTLQKYKNEASELSEE
jgi:hypothetical protein